MSLISDALEKARRDARERDGRPGYPIRAAPARRRSPWPWLAAVAASLALGLVLGMVLLPSATEPSVVGSSAAAPEAASSAARDDTLATGRTEPGPEKAEPGGEMDIVTSAPADPDRPGVQPSGVPPDPRPSSSSWGTEAGETPVEPRSTRRPVTDTHAQTVPDSADKRPASPDGESTGIPDPIEGETYRQRIRLPDGSELALRGIAWHATEPAALLDDRVFGIGDGLDDWTVVAVESGRVQIEWDGIRFYLELK